VSFWSFPSGHASGSLAVYAMLTYVILRGRDLQWWHLPLLVMTTAAILAVGFSRVFLQVHYPSDILGGYLVAGSWLCICIAGAELMNAHLRRPLRPAFGNR
jgi:membrane-associated phospholipid phosphatase